MTAMTSAEVLATLGAAGEELASRGASMLSILSFAEARTFAASMIAERDALAARVAKLEAELNEYREAVSACEGGNLCRCSIEFPERAEARNG